ncbi:hypothetical protein CTATCC11996_06858 [Comamonas testosteroni ATCC 11996]|nr:hypothetical protein CTATCC11996_06858 [Comamonas testosteroni ATCC 11996]
MRLDANGRSFMTPKEVCLAKIFIPFESACVVLRKPEEHISWLCNDGGSGDAHILRLN